jgi:putative membrane protein
MGSADLVPGVSGGTIALVIGIYERLVASIREGSLALGSLGRGSVARFRQRLGAVEWGLLIPLLLGILTAVGLLSSVLEAQLKERPTILAAAFFGLVVGSVWIAWRMIDSPSPMRVMVALVVGGVVFVALGLGGDATVTNPSLGWFFGAGALAICAMILPGISGSLILVLVGMYGAVLGSVTDRDFGALGVFVVGAVLGLAVFSQVLHWALANHRDTVLAGLVGLMAGSLRILWPWPQGVDSALLSAPADDWGWAVLATGIGLAVVLVISRLAAEKVEV